MLIWITVFISKLTQSKCNYHFLLRKKPTKTKLPVVHRYHNTALGTKQWKCLMWTYALPFPKVLSHLSSHFWFWSLPPSPKGSQDGDFPPFSTERGWGLETRSPFQALSCQGDLRQRSFYAWEKSLLHLFTIPTWNLPQLPPSHREESWSVGRAQVNVNH